MTNFTQCAAVYEANATLQDIYSYTGPIIGIDRSPTTLISRQGCREICGDGNYYYQWSQVSQTITTWVLPIIGILLQAPFESNEFIRTCLAIARWIGSPIASLSYILWNIKVSAKAALMVDMSVPFDSTPPRRTDFSSMRDSMYLLTAMNQYSMKHTAIHKEAEGLLRIVLFSKNLILTDTDMTLRRTRRTLAQEMREFRRRGAVPVFISTMWFLFAFALSIQAAFGDIGENTTAHDLALGCLLAWFPTLILASIVDRNPIAADVFKRKLNALVDHVRHALRDPKHREDFINSFRDQANFEELKAWIEQVAGKIDYMDNFFVQFAGQARIRWHYGAAHPILSDIENAYIAKKGRNWLADEEQARINLVLGSIGEGLIWFDMREFWQITSAVIIVAGACGGAFVLSFFTPTVGLGCRSGGYTIFFCISLGLLIIEMLVWLFVSPVEWRQPPWVASASSRLQRIPTLHNLQDQTHDRWAKLTRRTSSFLRKTRGVFVNLIVTVALLLPWKDKVTARDRIEAAVEHQIRELKGMTAQRKWEIFFFRPVEICNASWLIYIVSAQTVGSYRNCNCVTSEWGGGGGYLDFKQQDVTNSKWLLWYWTAGTVLTSLTMSVSMFYITVEWLQQSHISTVNYEHAMAGLRATRRYRDKTYVFRLISRLFDLLTLKQIHRLGLAMGLIRESQKTLLWTKHHTWTVPTLPTKTTSQHHAYPSIELTDHSSRPHAMSVSETPAMPISAFPPVVYSPRSRSRADSDISAHQSSSRSMRPRANSALSADTNTPLFVTSSYTHDGSERGSEDGRRRSSEASPFLLPVQSADAAGLLNAQTGNVQNRAGYKRKASDPGPAPEEFRETAGLGITVRERDVERDGT